MDCKRRGYIDVFQKKRPSFRTPFGTQQAKVSQTLLKSALQHFHHIFLSLWKKWSCKMSPLVISEILALFVNT